MKKILNYELFVFEGVKDSLNPKNNEEILNSLKTTYSNNQEDLLKVSCYMGILDGVIMALENGIDPSIDFNEPIALAVHNNQYEIVEFLLKDDRVDASDLNNYALKIAEDFEYDNILSLLYKDLKVRSKISKFKLSKIDKNIK